MRGTTYSSKLQCCFKSWRVICDGELALDVPEDNYPDMAAACAIAKAIMPSCFRVVTFVGGKNDTEYLLERGEWKAILFRDPYLRPA